MKVLLVVALFAAVASARIYRGPGPINNAQQISTAVAGANGIAIASGTATAGSGSGLGQRNNAQQISNARAGANGVAIASGSATAGREKRSEAPVEVKDAHINVPTHNSSAVVNGREGRFIPILSPLLGGGGGKLINFASSQNTAISVGK